MDDASRAELTFRRLEQQNLHEDVYATWVATATVVAVLGVQFSGRANVTPEDRKLADITCLLLAIFMMIWQTLMIYVPDVTQTMIMVGNISFVALIVLFFIVLIVGTSNNKFG